MRKEIYQFLKIALSSKEKLDGHFSSSDSKKWDPFLKNLRSKKFVSTVKLDPRSDEKLKRFSDAIGHHYASKDPGVPVKGSTGKTYKVKYHEDLKRFSCNCNHWVYDLSHLETPKDCKHIDQIKQVKEASSTMDLIRALHGMSMYGSSIKKNIEPTIANKAYDQYLRKKQSPS